MPARTCANPHQLFLIRDHAEGGLENRAEFRERVLDRLVAPLAPLVHAMHPGVERPRAHQRVGNDQIFESIAPHVAKHVRRQRRLELEHADGAAGPEHPVGRRIVERDGIQIEGRSAAFLDGAQGVVDDGERGETQEIHLEHAHLFQGGHVVLGDDDPLVVLRASTGPIRPLAVADPDPGAGPLRPPDPFVSWVQMGT